MDFTSAKLREVGTRSNRKAGLPEKVLEPDDAEPGNWFAIGAGVEVLLHLSQQVQVAIAVHVQRDEMIPFIACPLVMGVRAVGPFDGKRLPGGRGLAIVLPPEHRGFVFGQVTVMVAGFSQHHPWPLLANVAVFAVVENDGDEVPAFIDDGVVVVAVTIRVRRVQAVGNEFVS
jgi:hypothetical protein